MVKKLVLFLLLISIVPLVYSQRLETVIGEYTYQMPHTQSREEGCRIALNRAKLQAIGDKFGTLVSQQNRTKVTNKSGKTSTELFSQEGSEVREEWIETIEEPKYEITAYEDFTTIKVKVKGRIREIVRPYVEFKAMALRNGLDEKYEASDFKDGMTYICFFNLRLKVT